MKKEYRINGFDQIKAFYSWVFNNADKRITPQHISLYLFLINQGNRNNWVEWFKVPFDLGMTGACIGNKKTYYSCLKDLSDWKLIKYEKGINEWKAPLIRLEVLNSTTSDTATVPLPEPLPIPQVVPLPIPLPTHIYKLLTNNLKLITDNIESVLDFLKTINPDRTEINISFQAFWDIYNKKVGDKKKCEKKWNSFTDSVRQKIIDSLPGWLSVIKDKQFQPHPETYLNQQRWNDEIKALKPELEYEQVWNPETADYVKRLKR